VKIRTKRRQAFRFKGGSKSRVLKSKIIRKEADGKSISSLWEFTREDSYAYASPPLTYLPKTHHGSDIQIANEGSVYI
jgi:hypothetical protein